MNKGKEFWEPRKHGFDDDGPMPYEQKQRPTRPHGRPEGLIDDSFASGGAGAPTPQPTVDATVKWYKDDKGFGFVELANGQGDAFLHATALHAAGHDSILPGATMRVIVAAGAKGPQVSRVVSVDTSSVVEQRPRRAFDSPRDGSRGPRARCRTCRAPRPSRARSSGSTRPRASALSRSTTAARTSSSTSRRSTPLASRGSTRARR